MLTLGSRTLLAMSCRRCGILMPGKAFHRYPRRLNDRRPYIDRRCANCKWGASVKGKGLQ
jgi:hypothetical protein